MRNFPSLFQRFFIRSLASRTPSASVGVRRNHSGNGSNNNFLLSAGFSPTTSMQDFARRPLLIFNEGCAMTYNDVNAKSARLAECMNSIYKIGKGDVVLGRTSKRPSVFLYLATLRLGAIYVPLNPAYTTEETNHFIENAQPKLFVTCKWRDDVQYVHRSLCPSVVDERLISEQSSLFAGLLDVESVGDSDVATIIYTSGTTGKPKGAALSHRALRRNAEALVETWKFTSSDVLLHMLPFYHIHGMFLSFHCTLVSRSAAIFQDEFSAYHCAQLLPRSTVFCGVPTYYGRLLGVADSSACQQMRLFISGSAPLPSTLRSRFREAFAGHHIHERYGMSEAMVMTAVPYGEANAEDASVGRPLPGVNLRIAEDGVIEVKSDCLFNGYWREPEKTKAEFTPDGFFRTGDVGELDANGNLYLHGRQKDMIISGGLNVYPKEVEAVIEAEADIVECAVIGVAHDDFGEAVVAVCVPSPSLSEVKHDELKERLKAMAAKRLAPYKLPKSWIFVEELPRNSMGKIEKQKLRNIHGNMFGHRSAVSAVDFS